MSDAPPIVWAVPVAEIKDRPKRLKRTLSAAELKALADYAGVLAVKELSAIGEIRPWGKDGFELAMDLAAKVTQACVVTLEPVDETISEQILRRYLPGAEEPAPENEIEIEVAVDQEDPPDLLAGDEIDVGDAVAEALILALDPYPRAPGAALPQDGQFGDKPASPFSVLSRLKDKN